MLMPGEIALHDFVSTKLRLLPFADAPRSYDLALSTTTACAAGFFYHRSKHHSRMPRERSSLGVSMPTSAWRPFLPLRASASIIGKHVACQHGQSKPVIKFAIGEQSSVGGDGATAKLQRQAAVKIEPKSTGFCISRWVRAASRNPG